MKVVICGGKTGGHLVPGIALYGECKKRGMDCRYIMSLYDLQFPVVSRVAEGERMLVDLRGISRKLSLKTPLYMLKILGAFFRIFGVIRRFRPDAVVITGGYISNPAALAAVLLRRPLYIAEQNSVAGVTNRFYARFARRVFVNYPDTGRIPRAKAVVTGSPTLHKSGATRDKAVSFFGLGGCRTIIGITGGSQGARALNEAVLSILPELKKESAGVIWSAGSVDFQRMEKEGRIEALKKEYPGVKVMRFIERMDLFLAASDCVVSRAGASVLSEFVPFQAPSVLVPIKNSPDNHQYRNAAFLAGQGAAVILEEDRLDAQNLLASIRRVLDERPAMLKSLAALKERYFGEEPEKKIIDIVIQMTKEK